MEEMMEESLDSINDDEELEQEADEEVDKVLFELTDGKLGQAGKVGGALPVSLATNSTSLYGAHEAEWQLTIIRHRRKTRKRVKRRWRGCKGR
jgi:hypothetical protein